MDPNPTLSQPDFQTFLRVWMTRLEQYVHQLLHHLDQEDESKLEQLVHQVMTHYHEYFIAKEQVCRENVFLVLSPPWFSSYERTFLWVGGFKPGLVIHVVKSCGVEFGCDQEERLERLAAETKDEERVITERLARLEQEVVVPPMPGGKKTVVDRLTKDMEALVGCADRLREKTMTKVVGLLTMAQRVRFLAAMAQLQLRIRKRGQLRDAETPANFP